MGVIKRKTVVTVLLYHI